MSLHISYKQKFYDIIKMKSKAFMLAQSHTEVYFLVIKTIIILIRFKINNQLNLYHNFTFKTYLYIYHIAHKMYVISISMYPLSVIRSNEHCLF